MKFEDCIIFTKIYFGMKKTIPMFRSDLAHLFRIAYYYKAYDVETLRPIMDKLRYMRDQNLTQKEIQKYLIENIDFFKSERKKLQRKKEWVLF